MPSSPPQALLALVSARDASAQESAWTDLLAGFSGVIMHVARAMGGDHDAVMDRYAFVLDVLRRDDYRRLRAYASDGRGSFSTWLAVVVRRLCLDEYRHRYGRLQGDGASSAWQHAERRNLTDLVGNELELDALEASADRAPDALLRRSELKAALDGALGRLDPSDRLILRMRFEDDLSVPEIARALGEGSPFKLYRRIDKLLATIRENLEAGGIHEPAP